MWNAVANMLFLSTLRMDKPWADDKEGRWTMWVQGPQTNRGRFSTGGMLVMMATQGCDVVDLYGFNPKTTTCDLELGRYIESHGVASANPGNSTECLPAEEPEAALHPQHCFHSTVMEHAFFRHLAELGMVRHNK